MNACDAYLEHTYYIVGHIYTTYRAWMLVRQYELAIKCKTHTRTKKKKKKKKKKKQRKEKKKKKKKKKATKKHVNTLNIDLHPSML